MIIVSRIIQVKVDRRLNVTNKFKYQRRLSSRLAIVMFRGTPCIYIYYLIYSGLTNKVEKEIVCTMIICSVTLPWIKLKIRHSIA